MQKRLAVLILAVLITASTILTQFAFAQPLTTIHEFINSRVDEHFVIVVGEKGKPADSFAASDITIGLARHTPHKVLLPNAIHTEVSEKSNKILIGHPCENPLIKLDCEKWPFNEGEAIIKIDGNNLIVSGTTADDTRRAAKVVADYIDFPQLKKYSTIIVKGLTLNPEDLELEPLKLPHEFECGDNICETGEKSLCFADCAKINCFQKCASENFKNSFCKNAPTNPTVPECRDNEVSMGLGYCATGKVCCCEKEETSEQPEDQELPQDEESATNDKPTGKPNFFVRFINWMKRIFSLLSS